jgi:hypothetical protein
MKGIPEGLRSRARRWGELWGVPDLADSVTVELSRRFRSSLGLCRPVEGRVRLAAHLANGRPELLEEVLCHELAHVAVYRLHGRSVRPHGPEWKGLVRAARTTHQVPSNASAMAGKKAEFRNRCERSLMAGIRG